MGAVIDTVGFHVTKGGPTGAAATVSAGDSFTVRNFAGTANAKLVGVYRHDETGTQGFVQLKSPRLANTTTGVKLRALENPATEMLPPFGLQNLYSGDVLTVNLSGTNTTAHTTFGAFQVYYSTLGGSAARLHMWGDISGIVANVFTQTVAVDVATAGTWVTVLANHTADLMQADTTYALLGYNVDLAYGVVGIKSQETGNYRIVGPGTTKTAETSWYFARKSNDLGLPFIPVVNANNRGNINCTANAGKAVTGKISLIWAELSSAVS